jgi:hypothetical protein
MFEPSLQEVIRQRDAARKRLAHFRNALLEISDLYRRRDLLGHIPNAPDDETRLDPLLYASKIAKQALI